MQFFTFVIALVVACVVATQDQAAVDAAQLFKGFPHLHPKGFVPVKTSDVVSEDHNVRRRLLDPIYFISLEYTDSACKTATGQASITAGNECVAAYYSSGGTVYNSAQYVASVSGSTGTLTGTVYTSTDCSGSGVAPGTAATSTIGSCTLSSSSGLYEMVTTKSSSPSAADMGLGYYSMGYKDSACGTVTSGSVSVADQCMVTSQKTGSLSSQKLTVSGTTGTFTNYGTTDCTGTATSTSTMNIGDSCKQQTAMSATNPGLQTSAYLTTGQTSAASSSKSSCFASSETVQLQDGSVKALRDVQIGDRVLTAAMDGSAKGFSPVIAVPHAGDVSATASFVQLVTAEKDVKMTADHLVLAGSCDAAAPLSLVQAGSVTAGQCLQTTSGKAPVTATRRNVPGQGLSSVVTKAGGLVVVNGIAASPFAINHAIPEAWYSIHRLVYSVFPAALGFKLFQQTSERFGDLSVDFSL